MPLKTFISYCHEDDSDLRDLQKCLRPLQQEGILEIWSDGEIAPGSDWKAEILGRLDNADLVLLLLSRPYLASDFCTLESHLARERQRAGKAQVIPILMRDCDWTRFRDLQFLLGTKPVPEAGEKRDKDFAEISRKLRKISTDVRPTRGREQPELVAVEAWPKLESGAGRADAERLNDQAVTLADRGELMFARWVIERAKEVCRRHEGEDTKDFAVLLSNHALSLKNRGEFDAARADFEKALVIFEKYYGRRHPVFASHLAHLGGVLLELQEDQAACRHLKEAVGVLESSSAEDRVALASARIHLAGAYGAQGQTVKADDLLKRVLAEETTESKAAAAAISARGRLARQEGRLRAALDYFRRAVEIGEKVLGEKHPDVAIDLHNLGLVLRDLGKEREAEIKLRRAQDLLAEKLGESSPRVAWTQIEVEELEARSA
jgi:tetratricopeptide (TPR) repeat protein